VTRGALFLTALLVIAGCGPDSTEGPPGPGPGDNAGTLVGRQPMRLAPELTQAGAQGTHITYRSTGPDGKPVVVSGVVLVPSGTPPAGGWPVVSWGHGMVGRADSCAPSAHPDLMGYGTTILPQLVKAGYAVTATDYQGLGTGGDQPASWDSHAYDMIDAVRAANAVSPATSHTWVAAGHSEGGGAAIATNEVAGRYGRGLDYRGAAAISFSLPDVARKPDLLTTGALLLLLNVPEMQSLWLNLIAGFKADNPALDTDQFLGPRARPLLAKASTECFAGQGSLATTLAADHLPSTEFLPSDPKVGDQLAALFKTLSLPRSRAAGPMLYATGQNDVMTPQPDVQRLYDGLCAQDVPTTRMVVPGVDHLGILTAIGPDLVTWISQRFSGAKPQDNCG
jgi:hypothetical protein